MFVLVSHTQVTTLCLARRATLRPSQAEWFLTDAIPSVQLFMLAGSNATVESEESCQCWTLPTSRVHHVRETQTVRVTNPLGDDVNTSSSAFLEHD
ncbi:hypothetical protein ElyMa_002749000 [Elysia marginata]|uniref:Secreted protein n=1 Tax=Elysia marginata TaxID=1093978 RepID=A0AAV4HHH3_9GAST|nr:hypothetical protein ElyMa_002749000 [Elysia marginata]